MYIHLSLCLSVCLSLSLPSVSLSPLSPSFPPSLSSGEVCSGKSTLIDRLCSVSKRGNKRPSSSHNKKYLLSGCSLEYRPIDVYDDETDGEQEGEREGGREYMYMHMQLLYRYSVM